MSLPPVPSRIQLLDRNGMLTPVWAAWFRELYLRMGGSLGATAESVAGDLADHINDTAGAHPASAIAVAPSGNLSSIDAQAALLELQSDIDVINGTPPTPGPRGESAYQVAVDNGFVGTEAAWLASLVGPIGPPGPPSVAGIQGPEGPPGGAINTSFAVSGLDGFIYTSSLNGNAYLLEFT